jgi:hypothetical protein
MLRTRVHCIHCVNKPYEIQGRPFRRRAGERASRRFEGRRRIEVECAVQGLYGEEFIHQSSPAGEGAVRQGIGTHALHDHGSR